MNRFIFFLFTVWSVMGFDAVGQESTSAPLRASNFTSHALSGEQLTLSQVLEKQPVMLYFWATWCPYCKKETPNLVDFHNKYADKIAVIGINVGVNDSIAKIKNYVDEYQVHYPIIFDDESAISASYGVYGTPVFVVISQAQEILYRGHQFPIGIEQALED